MGISRRALCQSAVPFFLGFSRVSYSKNASKRNSKFNIVKHNKDEIEQSEIEAILGGWDDEVWGDLRIIKNQVGFGKVFNKRRVINNKKDVDVRDYGIKGQYLLLPSDTPAKYYFVAPYHLVRGLITKRIHSTDSKQYLICTSPLLNRSKKEDPNGYKEKLQIKGVLAFSGDDYYDLALGYCTGHKDYWSDIKLKTVPFTSTIKPGKNVLIVTSDSPENNCEKKQGQVLGHEYQYIITNITVRDGYSGGVLVQESYQTGGIVTHMHEDSLFAYGGSSDKIKSMLEFLLEKK